MYAKLLLQDALENGHVFIVHNAEPEWPKLSAQRFVPETAKLLESNRDNIQVIAARERFEGSSPEPSVQWRIDTVLRILDDLK